MSKFNKGDEVIPQEGHWFYSFSVKDGSKSSSTYIQVGKKYTVENVDEDGDVFLNSSEGEILDVDLVVNESCLIFADESPIILAEFEEVDSTTDSTYCICGGPSKFNQFDTFSYHSCTLCGLEKKP